MKGVKLSFPVSDSILSLYHIASAVFITGGTRFGITSAHEKYWEVRGATTLIISASLRCTCISSGLCIWISIYI